MKLARVCWEERLLKLKVKSGVCVGRGITLDSTPGIGCSTSKVTSREAT